MNVNAISAAQKTNFSGLWGTPRFDYTQELYGGEFECDYYTKEYHPCIDETPNTISRELWHEEERLRNHNLASAQCAHGDYISVKEGSRLNMTLAEFERLKQDCQNVLDGKLPENKMIQFLG